MRGLKQFVKCFLHIFLVVAPFTGAWIETVVTCKGVNRHLVAPFTGAWIETMLLASAPFTPAVAPFTGAWIETVPHPKKDLGVGLSHPLRVRGLKPAFH